jgi:hypothetical protein
VTAAGPHAGGGVCAGRVVIVTGRVFEVEGGAICVADGWRHGPRADKGARWDPAEIGPVVGKLIAAAPPPDPVHGAAP